MLGLTLRAQMVSYSCRYWFDQNHAQVATATFGDGSWQTELDVGSLEDGLHTFYIQICDTSLVWNMPKAYMFYKLDIPSDLTCRCWFDQDIEHLQTSSLGDGHLLLDVDTLVDGIHTLNVMLEGNAPKSYLFMKVAIQDPAHPMQYRCWFDNDCSALQTGLVGAGIFELEVGDLSNGLHTVSIQLDNGTPSLPQCYMFCKRPVGGYIAKWEYWLNGDVNNRHTIELSPFVDTLDIITLLPVDPIPIRSSSFHFHPNGDEPYLNAKNEITFRFWDAEYQLIDQSAVYVDESFSEPIVADTLERNTTVSMAAPRDNQIHWFKLAAGRGDYLSFKANKACSMQLFASSGEEVYAVSGPESIQEGGANVWDDGAYYLAVHDVTGSGDTLSVTYSWAYRYTIASYDVHLVGNGGCSTITLQGNGFNSLLDVYLVNWQNDTIRRLDIGHESNTKTTVSFNFYQENLGAYDAVFEFYEETIRINGALEVQEPVDIVLTSSVSYPSTFLRNTPCTYTYTITNNGNMYAYAVPIFVYIASPTLDGISHIEFDGLDLPSIIDDVDLDSLSLSLNELMEFKVWAEAFGDDHYFIKTAGIDEATGDSVVVRSNFFLLNLAPFETKTLTLKINSNEAVNVWMTVPNETISPINFINDRYDSWFCNHADKISCIVNAIGGLLDLASLIPGTGSLIGLGSCFTDAVSVLVTHINIIACQNNQIGNGYFQQWRFASTMRSLVKMFVTCVILQGIEILSIKKYIEIVRTISKAITGALLVDKIPAVEECINAFSSPKPSFMPGIPSGGKSTPVNACEPNEIRGYLSESGSHFMRQEIQNITFEIESENDTTATAAAHTIIVRDTLDVAKFDVASLAAIRVTIGDKVMDLHGENSFIYTLDLRPDLYVIAQIQQECDLETGVVVWTIKSLDPMTMEPTTDPNQGALPVNYNGEGIATFTYNINLKETFPDGTEISNRVGIIFDQEEVIMTPTWTNIVDAVKPTSHIDNVVVDADTLNFSFVSSDNRSGVWYHTLYYRNDSTEMEWKIWKNQIVEDHYKLVLENHLFTEYLVMATDSAGNHEDKNLVAEYTYGDQCQIQTKALQTGWNWFSTNLDITLADLKSALEDALENTDIQIKSKIAFTKYTGNTWRGTLKSMDVAQMYKINVPSDCVITLFGNPINPTEHPVTINKGANWIGFPFNSDMSLSTAFNGFAVSGDMVKSKDRYSSFNGSKWRGTFNTLEFGKGYIYKTNVQNSRTFTFPINTK